MFFPQRLLDCFSNSVGRENVQGITHRRALPIMGYGSLFHSALVSPANRRIVVSGARVTEYQPAVASSLDSDRKLVLVTEGTESGVDMLWTSGSDGPLVCLCVYFERT